MKSVLITGVSGGIGRATASCLAHAGWRVYGVDIKESDVGDDLAGFWHGDIAEEPLWRDTIVPGLQDAEVRGLVNNAAVQPCNRIQDTTLEEWNRTMAVNLGAAFLATKYLAPLLGKSVGSIVNVSSVHALATSPGMAAYVTSKGGLLALTRAAALELASRGIRVNAVLPGAIDTGMLTVGLTRGGEEIEVTKLALASRTPIKRIGKVNEVTGIVEFLLDNDKSSFITGQSFIVDGGALAKLSSE